MSKILKWVQLLLLPSKFSKSQGVPIDNEKNTLDFDNNFTIDSIDKKTKNFLSNSFNERANLLLKSLESEKDFEKIKQIQSEIKVYRNLYGVYAIKNNNL